MKRKGSMMIAIALVAICIAAVVGMNSEGRRKEITVNDARGMIEKEKDILLLDVRTKAEYEGELGHLEHALLIPVQELEQRIAELDSFKDKTIIAYCRTGNRSGKAMEFLGRKGFHVVNMLGGMVEWNEKKFPITLGK